MEVFMIRLIDRQLKTIDKEEAEELLSYNTMEQQRKLSTDWVQELVEEQRKNLFLGGHIAVAHNGKDGPPILANGQHQLKMVSQTGEPIEVMFETYSIGDRHDLAELFARFDSHRVRTLQQMNSQQKASLGVEWPARFVNMLVSAASRRHFTRNIHRRHKAALLARYLDFGNFVFSIIGNEKGQLTNDSKHLQKSPVFYGMLLTYEKSKSDAKEFWTDVRDGENLTKLSPQMHLRNFLLTTVADRGLGVRRTNKASPNEFTSRIITAWNAYRKGKSLKQLKYYPENEMPEPR
jgi:hypothetical protein